MANYQEYQNFTINPRKAAYTEEKRYRNVKKKTSKNAVFAVM
ncbi:hypothetical protein AN392_01233 [Pseudoalteromonas sp. P1-16-1b]|nr:hypothetical protein [Pseudoalteromonas sp. P1-16-1b]KPZ65685.1 hypothetical protein AN392_01233 [Pseudoalteromonas sp. P1-16-1b]